MKRIIPLLLLIILVGCKLPTATPTVAPYPPPQVTQPQYPDPRYIALDDDLPYVDVRNNDNLTLWDKRPEDDPCTFTTRSITTEAAPENAIVSGVQYWMGVVHYQMSDLFINIEKDDRYVNIVNRPPLSYLDFGYDDDPEDDADIDFRGRYTDAFDGLPVNGEWLLQVGDCAIMTSGMLDWIVYRVYYVTEAEIRVAPRQLTFVRDFSEPAAEVQEAPDYEALIAQVADQPTRVIVTTRPGTVTAQSVADVERTLESGFAATVNSTELYRLLEDPNVLLVVPDLRVQTQLTQSRPLMNADDVQALGITGEGTVVFPIDTGIDRDHPDLANDIIGQKCFTDGACPPNRTDTSNNAEDDNGHGTAVAGIITGDGLRNIAPRGIAPGAKVYPIKVLDQYGGGWMSDIQAGVEHATQYARQHPEWKFVISMSLGGGGPYEYACDSVIPSLAAALNAAREAGITIFVAAGNEGYTNGLAVPACMSAAVSVGSVWDQSFGTNPCEIDKRPDVVACYSNTGANQDLLAPVANSTTYLGGGETNNFGGTSAATPHAAALAALMLDNNPYMTPAMIEQVMKLSGKPIVDYRTGRTFPRIDALAAVEWSSIYISNIGAGELQVTAVEVVNNSCWLSVDAEPPLSLFPGNGINVPVIINECGMTSGDYTDTIRVRSNDETNPSVDVTVTLHVVGDSPFPTPTATPVTPTSIVPTATATATNTPVPTVTNTPQPGATNTPYPTPTAQPTSEFPAPDAITLWWTEFYSVTYRIFDYTFFIPYVTR